MPRKKARFPRYGKFPSKAKRINIQFTTTNKLKRFEQENEKTTNGLQNIAPGMFSKVPGRIVIKQHIKDGKPTKHYKAMFDAHDKKAQIVKGKKKYTIPEHEAIHIRQVIFGHEHGIPRNEYGALMLIEETAFNLPSNRPFKSNPEHVSATAPEKIRSYYDYAVASQRNSKRFTIEYKKMINAMEVGLTVRFHSRRAFLRAYVAMNRDPLMRQVMKILNEVPVEIKKENDYDPRIPLSQKNKLKLVVLMYEFLVEKAKENQKRRLY